MSLYLGLDFSLTHSGICLYDGSTGHQYETIKPTEQGIKRLLYIERAVLSLLDRYPVAGAAIEQYAYGKGGADGHNAGRTFSIGEGGGVARLALAKRNIPVVAVAPGTLKKFVTYKGSAPKSVMIKEVMKRWGEDLDDDNLADACGLAHMAYHFYTDDDTGLVKVQKDALKSVNIEFTPVRKRERRAR